MQHKNAALCEAGRRFCVVLVSDKVDDIFGVVAL